MKSELFAFTFFWFLYTHNWSAFFGYGEYRFLSFFFFIMSHYYFNYYWITFWNFFFWNIIFSWFSTIIQKNQSFFFLALAYWYIACVCVKKLAFWHSRSFSFVRIGYLPCSLHYWPSWTKLFRLNDIVILNWKIFHEKKPEETKKKKSSFVFWFWFWFCYSLLLLL